MAPSATTAILLRTSFVGLLLAASGMARGQASGIVDMIAFGSAQSEQAHGLAAIASQIVPGALETTARELRPLEPATWDGGKVAFTLKVDPSKPTYFTLKLWGGDFGEDRGRLLLFCNGKQLGQRHLGDVDILDILSNEPRFPGRFTYKTLPLPKAMTMGKDSIQLEIRGLGRIWGYGNTWELFQKVLDKPSRGIYAAYTHTDPLFIPPPDEVQGAVSQNPPARLEPGEEVMEQLERRVSREIVKLLQQRDRLRQMQLQFLARAYHVKWTPAHQNPRVVDKLVEGLDTFYKLYREQPRLAESDPETWNADWFGLGPCGDVIRLMHAQLEPLLDQPVAGTDVTRRQGWSAMLQHCRDWHAKHRRQYTNQSMINDLYGIYLANRGIAAIDPSSAWSEARARRYLYESVGLQPWLGNDTDDGGSEKPLGERYMQLTEKGLTRELGYVGSYGEVTDWVVAIYNATRPSLDQPGDEKIKAQLIRIVRARANFRHPAVDRDGARCMQLETVVGWRDTHYPGDITYCQRSSWDGTPVEAAAATLDPHLIGYVQQMFEDNQFFSQLRERMKDGGFRVTAGLLHEPDDYELVRAQPAQPHRLPMSPGQPDFVFADEENGVVAVKNGDEVLFASLYWRARYAVNFLARVHYLTPTIERDATIWQDVQFEDSGAKYTRDDRVIEAQSGRHERSRGDVTQALAGEVLPIARVPDGVRFRPGQENVHAGKGSFYSCRYGDYLIAMNCTTNQTFSLTVPNSERRARELVSGRDVATGSELKVGPRTTAVVYFGEQ